jgi:hypothetical protein
MADTSAPPISTKTPQFRRIAKVRSTCLQEFDRHWQCLERNNQVSSPVPSLPPQRCMRGFPLCARERALLAEYGELLCATGVLPLPEGGAGPQQLRV